MACGVRHDVLGVFIIKLCTAILYCAFCCLFYTCYLRIYPPTRLHTHTLARTHRHTHTHSHAHTHTHTICITTITENEYYYYCLITINVFILKSISEHNLQLVFFFGLLRNYKHFLTLRYVSMFRSYFILSVGSRSVLPML